MLEKIKKMFQKGFLHIVGSSVINKCITFLSSIVLVRILTKQEYGVFIYAWNIYSLLILMNGLGSESAVLQICSEKYSDIAFTNAVTNYGAKIGLRFNALLCILLAVIGFCIPLPIEDAKWVLRILCLLPVFQYLYNLSLVTLRYKRENKGYSRIAVINTIVLFLASVCGAFLFREQGMVIGYYIAFIVSVIIVIKQYHIRFFAKEDKLDKQNRKSFINIAFVSMCNNGLSQLLYLLDVFILGIVISDEGVLASYKIATTIPTALTFIPQAVITYIYTEFAYNNRNGEWCLKNYKKILRYIGGFNLIISMFMFVFADFIVGTIFGYQYLDAVPVFRVLSINYFVSGTFRIISGNLLVTQRKLKFNLFVALFSGTINIVLDCIFIKLWGSMGAALATITVVIISSICSTIYLIYTFKSISKKENVR